MLKRTVSLLMVVKGDESRCEKQLQVVMDPERYSKFDKLLRVTAYVVRFINNAAIERENRSGPISTEQLREAEMMWIREIQLPLYENSKMSWLKKNLGTFADEKGILRCKGRLKEADLGFDKCHPILIPKKGYIQTLLVAKSHEDT